MTETSSRAEYRQADRCFERTQSRTMSQLEWEDRRRAIKTWAPHIAAGIGTLLLMALAFPTAEFVVDLMAGKW